MTHYEVGFKLQHDCPFNEISRSHPKAVITHWCNYVNNVLEISCDEPGEFQALQKDIPGLASALGVRILRRVRTANSQQLVLEHMAPHHYQATSTTIQENNCLEIQPTIYSDGWEWYRVITFSKRDAANLFRDLEKFCKVEVTYQKSPSDSSVRDNFRVSTTNLFGGLTSKQAQALAFALENGYYAIPRRIKTEDMAKRLKLSRTTYEEHLRKAETKVLGAVAQYMKLQPSINSHTN
jgi:predicted DNA binding protein